MKSLGRYDIVDELGRGAMGIVYRGRDPKIDRIVALKCIRPDLFDDQGEASHRFQQEMLALGRLIHPNIVTIFDAGEDSASNYTYIVMEYVEGKSLAQSIKSGEPFTIEQIREIGIQICNALDFAHSKGVIHRDIKPGNILLTPDLKTIKVTDFGIARLDGTAMTQTNRLLGTPQYMSPEQCNAEPLDGRSDLFAVGALLYELLTKQKPFPGETVHVVMQNILNRVPSPPSSISPQIPRGLSATVMRALEKDRTRRFSTGAEMAEALATPEREVEGEEEGEGGTMVLPAEPKASDAHVLSSPQSQPQPRSRLGWALVAVPVLLALLYGGWSLLRDKPNSLPGETVRAERVASGTVDLTTTPEGAEIRIDGVMKGVSPLIMTLPVGSHELVVTKEGHHPLEATIDVPSGEKVPIDLKLAKEEVSQ
jgi:serine/threonine protein kinase